METHADATKVPTSKGLGQHCRQHDITRYDDHVAQPQGKNFWNMCRRRESTGNNVSLLGVNPPPSDNYRFRIDILKTESHRLQLIKGVTVCQSLEIINPGSSSIFQKTLVLASFWFFYGSSRSSSGFDTLYLVIQFIPTEQRISIVSY